MRRQLPVLFIWTNSYERLTWTPILVLIAHQLDAPESLAFAADAYSAANLVGNLVLGAASDRLGAYRVAGVSLLLLAITTLLHVQPWSALAFVLIRAMHGFLASAVTPTSLSAATEGADPNSRGRIMARLGLVIALASVVASPFAGRLVDALQLTKTLQLQAAFLLLIGAVGLWAGGVRLADKDRPAGENLVEAQEERTEFDPRITAFACAVGFSVMFGQNVLFYAFPSESHGRRTRSCRDRRDVRRLLSDRLGHRVFAAVFQGVRPVWAGEPDRGGICDLVRQECSLALGLVWPPLGLMAVRPFHLRLWLWPGLSGGLRGYR